MTRPLIKVLFVNPASACYGSERSMLALLRACEFNAEVVCPDGGALERELKKLNVMLHPLIFGKYSFRQNPFWQLSFFLSFRKILRRVRPEIVAINLDGNTSLVTLAAMCEMVPLLRFCRFEFQPPIRWLDRWSWLQAQAIICPSESVARQVREWLPNEFHQRVHCFYDSFSGYLATQEEVDDFRRELGLGNARLVGCVGRLHLGKRIEVAIEAFAQIHKNTANVYLLIIGDSDGSPAGKVYTQKLQQIARKLGVSDSVIFVGFRQANSMPAAMAALDVCVLPSESESFGMVLMEAWAQGVPTIASDVAGCGEITRASGGGLLAAIGDVSAFTVHLRTLLTNHEKSQVMGQQGKEWVERTCDPAGYATRFADVMDIVKTKEKSKK